MKDLVEYVARFLESVSSSPTDRRQRQAGPVKQLGERAEIVAGTAEKILLTLEQTPARITQLQLRRLEACDGHTVRGAEALAFMEGFAALERAAVDEASRASSIEDGVDAPG